MTNVTSPAQKPAHDETFNSAFFAVLAIIHAKTNKANMIEGRITHWMTVDITGVMALLSFPPMETRWRDRGAPRDVTAPPLIVTMDLEQR
jgi:hypothetical protein